MYEQMKKALAKIGMTVKPFFPNDLEKVLLDQAAEIDRLRADYGYLRSQIKEGK